MRTPSIGLVPLTNVPAICGPVGAGTLVVAPVVPEPSVVVLDSCALAGVPRARRTAMHPLKMHRRTIAVTLPPRRRELARKHTSIRRVAREQRAQARARETRDTLTRVPRPIVSFRCCFGYAVAHAGGTKSRHSGIGAAVGFR